MKYIIILAAIVSVILYYGIGEAFRRLKKRSVRQRLKRLIVCALIVALLASQIDFVNIFMKTGAETVAAEESDVGTAEEGSRMITAFTELSDEVREQIVPVGTTLDELVLPDTLEAICITAYATPDELGGGNAEDEEVESGEETDPDEEVESEGETDPDEEVESEEETDPDEEVESEEETDPNEDMNPGEETPVAPEGDLDKEAGPDGEAPNDSEEAIASEGVEESEPTTDITLQTETGSFVMPEYQSQPVIEIKTLEGSLTSENAEQSSETSEIREETVIIENITWQPEPEYDCDTEGEYIFTAVLPEGYALTDGVNTPQITVTVGDIALLSGDIMPIAITFDGGSGSSDSPWLISSLDTLQRFRDDVNNGTTYENKYIKLTKDINLGGSSGNKWTRIGTWTAPFKGTFDGAGHTISGLYVDESSNDQGLFGSVKSGTIRNLSVDGSVSVPDSGTVIYNVAGIVGIVIEGTIENCTNYVTVSGRDYVGGICGLAGKDSKITNCTNKGSVTGQAVVGGIVGKSDNTNASSKSEGTAGTISGCTNSGTITAKNVQSGAEDHTGAGGIAGANHDSGVIKDCHNDGQVNGYVRVGGIVGYDQPGNKGTIRNCYNTGNVYGYNNGIKNNDGYEHGGIVGYAPYVAIEQCYNTGSIYGKDQIGGIAGKIDKNNSYIKNSCNLGSVTASGTDCGGIAGQTYNEISITYCYSSGTLSGSNRGGIVGNSADGTWSKMGYCYYLSGTASGECGTGNYTSSGEIKTMTRTELESGEFALYLQGKLGSSASLIWVQNLKNVYGDGKPTSKGPIPTGDSKLKVLTVTFMKKGSGTSYNTTHAKRYTNPNFGVTMPTDLSPSDSGKYKVVWWTSTNAPASGTQFTADSTVTGDTTVYAYEQEMYAGESSTITKTITYGDGLTLKLSDSMKYAAGTSSANKFTYTIKSGNDALKATISGDTLTIPTTAGASAYTLKITASEKSPQLTTYAVGSYGTSDVTLTVKVTINKANSTVTTKPTVNTLTYTGSAQALVKAGSGSGGTMQYNTTGASSEFSTTIPKGTDAGSYTVWYKVAGDNNHNDTTAQSVTVTIKKATPTVTAPKANNITYTGSAQALVSGGSTTGGTLQYKVDSGNWQSEIPKATGAGNYIVYYKVVGGTNYNDVAQNSLNVTVSQAKAAVTAPQANNLTYTGKPQGLVTAGTTTFGTLLYSLEENGTYSTSIPTGTDKGTYKVWYKVKGTENYTGVDPQSITVDIKRAKAAVTAPQANDLTYTGRPQGLVTAGTTTFGTLLYSLEENGTYSTSIPTGTDKGTYKVWYKVEGTENYTGVDPQSITVDIKQAAAAVTAPQANDLTYTGEAQELVAAGTTTLGTLLYSLEENGTYTTSIPTGTDKGTYKVWYKVEGTENYTGVSEQYVTAEIKKGKSAVTKIPGAETLFYTGEAQPLVTAGTAKFGTVLYSLQEEGPYFADIPTGTEKGSYTVWYKVEGTENYDGVEPAYVTVKIVQAAAKVTAPEAKDLTYTGEELELVTAGTTTLGILQYSLEEEGIYSTSIPTGTDVGSYTVWYKVDGNENYEGVDPQSVEVVIAQAVTKVTAPEARKLTYTGEAQELVTAGATTFGTLQYSLKESEGYSLSIPTAADAGVYTVWYKVDGTENYTDVNPQSVDVTVQKATPEVTAPEARNLTYTGEAQELAAEGATTGGTLEYRLGEDGEWGTDIPVAAEVGIYTVYYRIVGDNNHNDVDEQFITVRILAQPQPDNQPGDSSGSNTGNSSTGSSSGSNDGNSSTGGSSGSNTGNSSTGGSSGSNTGNSSTGNSSDWNGQRSETDTTGDALPGTQTGADGRSGTDSTTGKGRTNTKSSETVGRTDNAGTNAASQTDRDAGNKAGESTGKGQAVGKSGVSGRNGRNVQAELKDGEIVIKENSAGASEAADSTKTANGTNTVNDTKTANGTDVNGNGAGTGSVNGTDTAIVTGSIARAESETTILSVGEGDIVVAVVSDEYRCDAGVADTIALANVILTPEQKQLVDDGETIEIRVEVKDISEQVAMQDKDTIEEGLRVGESGLLDLTLGDYIDISVYIKVGDGDWDTVTQTDDLIEVVIEIPEDLQFDGGTYYIARAHEGKYALLDDLDNEPDTITIKTGAFSTYAIVYRQVPETGAAGTNPGTDYFVSHLRTAAILCIVCVPVLGILCFLLLWKRRKKEEETY